jgi:uncharacterized SAM-binding protein YcdF (DUF218 family)
VTLQAILTALLLPPLLLVLAGLAGVALAWRGWRAGLVLAGLAGLFQLFRATPLVAGLLMFSLQVPGGPTSPGDAPGAIVVLGGDAARTPRGVDVGALTLERLRTGAALHRRTGLPLLVTAGPNAPGETPLALAMARSLQGDFGTPVRWVEPAARDTRDNAVLSAALLRQNGIGSVHLVTHAWHMRRAMAAFGRAGLTAWPAPLRAGRLPDGRASDWLPGPAHLAESWYALREWLGVLVYAIRD